MSYIVRRDDSSVSQFRKRTPADVVGKASGRRITIMLPGNDKHPVALVTATIGPETKFSLRTRDGHFAVVRKAAADAQLEAVFAAIKRGPRQLNQREVVALSGAVYRLYVETHEDNPGSPDLWAAFKGINRAAMEGRIHDAPPLLPAEAGSEDEARELFGADLTAGINTNPALPSFEALEARFGPLAEWALATEGLDVDEATWRNLLRHVGLAAQDAGWRLKRASQGDYSPDPRALRFPAFPRPAARISLDGIFERWEREAAPSASTLSTWRGVWKMLREHVGAAKADNIASITPEDVIAWKDALLGKALSPKTINDTYIAAAKALFRHAVRDRLLTTSPVEGVKVSARASAGTRMLPYSDEEVGRLLVLARHEKHSWGRWLPWLAAGTGARIGELAQLSGQRVTTENGIVVLRIAPAEDGGSLKNEGSERTIPLHPTLIAEGFLEFVASKGTGPLFYYRTSGDPGRKHASKGVTNRLAGWVRGRGFDDPRKAPNHAFRHWFKSAAVRAGVADSLADAIQGHAHASEAARYRHFDPSTLRSAIALITIPMPSDERR